MFNQTEIRGIKWRKLSANPDYTTVDQLEDPVLVSYSKCIKADILSVWRRVARSSDQPRYTTDQLSYNKELWIFWYGDEPENLSRLISPDLRGTVTLVVSHVYHVNQVKNSIYAEKLNIFFKKCLWQVLINVHNVCDLWVVFHLMKFTRRLPRVIFLAL